MKRLSLSLKKKSKRLDGHKTFGEPGVYLDGLSYPSGIMNSGNNCYASAVLQCLFNLPGFALIAKEIWRVHPDNCNNTCSNISMYGSF